MANFDRFLGKRKRQINQEILLEVIFEFIEANIWTESEKILKYHPELFSDEADSIFEDLITAASQREDGESKLIFEVHREILQRCREVGVDEAYKEMKSETLSSILEELSQPFISSGIPRRIQLSQQAISLVTREQDPELWAALHDEMGTNLIENPLGNKADNLEQAIEHYQQALEIRTRNAIPKQWAMTQVNLGRAFYYRQRGNRATIWNRP